MANSHSISMGVPLHSSPNHLTTSSSAIANYSIALTQQPVRLCFWTTVVHQGLMGITDLVERLLWNWTCHFTVKRTDNAEMAPLSCLTLKMFGLDLLKTV